MMQQVMMDEDLGQLFDRIKDRLSRDLLFAAKYLYGFEFLDSQFHSLLGSFLASKDPHRKAIFAPRGGGKTTLARVKQAVRFLNNPTRHRLLVAYNSEAAIRNLREVHSMIAGRRSAARVSQLYPDLWTKIKDLPTTIESKGSIVWNPYFNDAHPDPTFRAVGIDSGLTSAHYPTVWIDDLIDEKSARSPTEVQRAFDWHGVLINCLEHQALSPIDLIGTFYDVSDAYSKMLKDPGIREDYHWFIHPAFWSTFTEDGKEERHSFWPSKFPVEMEERIRNRMGDNRFAALMQQRPTQPGESVFREEWNQYYTWHPSRKDCILRSDGEEIFLEDITVGMIFDPALGGPHQAAENAIIVAGQDFMENYYILDAWAEKVPIDSGLRTFLEHREKWHPNVSACEDVLFQRLIFPALRKQSLALSGNVWDITSISPQGRNKAYRILSVQPLFQQGRVWLHRSMAKLREQLREFRMPGPGVKNTIPIDLLDCLGYLPEVLYPPQEPRFGRLVPRGSGRPKSIIDLGADSISGY